MPRRTLAKIEKSAWARANPRKMIWSQRDIGGGCHEV
jgi:hypothetical protein